MVVFRFYIKCCIESSNFRRYWPMHKLSEGQVYHKQEACYSSLIPGWALASEMCAYQTIRQVGRLFKSFTI
jgi:hypothetical protein